MARHRRHDQHLRLLADFPDALFTEVEKTTKWPGPDHFLDNRNRLTVARYVFEVKFRLAIPARSPLKHLARRRNAAAEG